MDKDRCRFCELKTNFIVRNNLAFAIADKYPVVKDHVLVASLRHTRSYFDLDYQEMQACMEILHKVRNKILRKDKTVSGFNIGINDGIDAGQTIFHCHIHLIPRRKGDVRNPRGGIRNMMPHTSNY